MRRPIIIFKGCQKLLKIKEHGNHYKMCVEMHERRNKKGKKINLKEKIKKIRKLKKRILIL